MVSGTYHVCKYVGVCSIIMWTRIYDGDLIILACVWMVPTATGMRTSSTQSENVIMNKTRRAREEWENCKGFWGPLHCTNHQEVFFCDEVKSSSLWGNDGDWMPITSQQFNKVNYHFKKYCASLGPRRLKLWICYLTFYSRTFRNRFDIRDLLNEEKFCCASFDSIRMPILANFGHIVVLISFVRTVTIFFRQPKFLFYCESPLLGPSIEVSATY